MLRTEQKQIHIMHTIALHRIISTYLHKVGRLYWGRCAHSITYTLAFSSLCDDEGKRQRIKKQM